MLDTQDQETIALVWSFTEDLQEIPYRVHVKMGKKDKVSWRCTCPSFTKRRAYTCKHISTIKEEAKLGVLLIDSRYSVTELGKKMLDL